MKATATVNTASNYRGLNGKTFPIVEILNNNKKMIVCLEVETEYGKTKIDFSRSEVIFNK